MELSFKTNHIASVDTCILLRMITHDIPEQYQAARELLLSGQDFYVDYAAVAESVYVLTKVGVDRAEIAKDILDLLLNPMFICDRDFYAKVFAQYTTHPSLSFDDCVLAARAEAKGCTPLYTFDRKLAHQSTVAELVK